MVSLSPPGVIGPVVMGLLLRKRMRNNLYSCLMLTNILEGAGCMVMIYLELLLPWAQTQ